MILLAIWSITLVLWLGLRLLGKTEFMDLVKCLLLDLFLLLFVMGATLLYRALTS